MKHFGFDRFAVVGHDRGGRVAHRLALDHPQAVSAHVGLDIVPTHYLYTHVTKAFVDAYFHWFLYIRPAPFPGEHPQRRRGGQLRARRAAGAARGVPARLSQSRECARHVRGLSRLGRHRHAVRRSGSRTRRSPARCMCCGPRMAPWAGCTTCWASGRSAARMSPARRCREDTTSRRRTRRRRWRSCCRSWRGDSPSIDGERWTTQVAISRQRRCRNGRRQAARQFDLSSALFWSAASK